MGKLGILLLVVSFIASPAFAADFLDLEGMVGVPSGGPGFVIRGIPGAGAPWVIDRGTAVIDEKGNFRVKVRGLVLHPTLVPPPNGGTNPVPFFIATLTCEGGFVATIGPAPADVEGNSDILGTISLPSSCFGVIVLVRNAGGTQGWLAATGF